jgi:putative DNA primase/helicase
MSPEEELIRLGMRIRVAPSPQSEVAEPPRFSDVDLALRFADRHAHRLRFVAEWGKWLSWDGACWRFDTTLAAFDLARDLCQGEAAKCNTKARKTIASAKTVAAVVTIARADRRLAATAGQWDADLWLINTPDGAVDLRTGEKRSHRQEDYMTKMTTPGPRGDCPMFKAFLNRIMGGDEALTTYLQRVFGYCLTGDISEQAIFFNHGVGANGKTVLMSTVSGILGDYCLATPIETFTESKNDRHPTELARMRGARLVTATETEAGRHWAESRLKELTGGERIPARFMHKDFFEYLPAFKPVISGNHKPSLRSVGVAMRRRVNMIPFTVTIPQTERDPQLAEKLKAEWPGILQWMIIGCLDWQRRGLAPPDAVTTATDAYFKAQDSLSFWLEECCERDPNAWTLTTALFSSWKVWAEKAGVRHGDIASFGDALGADDAFVWKHKKTGNGYEGLRVRQDDDLPL